MRNRAWLLILCTTCGLLASPRPALAQAQYRPSRPTLSPWLNLYDREPGPLGNYLSRVRPQMQLRSTLHQYDARLRFQGSALASLGGEVAGLTERDSIRATGTGSGFMDYSHYYPTLGSASRTVRAASRRRAASDRGEPFGARAGRLSLLGPRRGTYDPQAGQGPVRGLRHPLPLSAGGRRFLWHPAGGAAV